MKYLFLGVFLLAHYFGNAQQNCEYAQNINDTIGTYRSTKDFVMHEKIFGGTSNYLFFTLINSNGLPLVGLQYVQKSDAFIKALCLDAQSKIYLQLDNGKVVTLVHTQDESCGSMVRVPDESRNTRMISGNFLFLKGSFEDLKSSPINLVRIKFVTETLDFALKSSIVSELTKQTYYPGKLFIDYLKCIE